VEGQRADGRGVRRGDRGQRALAGLVEVAPRRGGDKARHGALDTHRDRLVPVEAKTLDRLAIAVRQMHPSLFIADSTTELARGSRIQVSAVLGALHELAHAGRGGGDDHARLNAESGSGVARSPSTPKTPS
jgi:hypothetical protein